MSILKKHVLDGLRNLRENILAIGKDNLTYAKLAEVLNDGSAALLRAGPPLGPHARVTRKLTAYAGVKDLEILEALRAEVISQLDYEIKVIDATVKVRSVLEEYIVRVKDVKLATLLREFNETKDTQPNLAAIGYRTILGLLIGIRAAVKDTNSALAKQQDLKFEPDIKAAIAAEIFDEGQIRRLNRFLTGGSKDKFDIVAHKKGGTALVVKDDLSDAVDLLDALLPSIL